AFAGSPSGIPDSTQRPIVAISSAERRFSSRNGPQSSSGCQGGISFDSVTAWIIFPWSRASANDIRENGAASPGRWQDAHLLNTIGATFSAKVGGGGGA